MSSNISTIVLKNIWKKYSRDSAFHRSLREDILHIFNSATSSDHLEKNEFWALQDINLTFTPGKIYGLYGNNGAGKTTILKLIANVTFPSKGDLIINGKVAPLLAVGAGFHMDLTGKENIYVNGAILGMSIKKIKQKMNTIINFSGIKDYIDMPVKKYSSGMYLRLAFSIAIHSEADIFLIDEVIAVGDTNFQEKCLLKIKELKEANKNIILVSQDLTLLQKISDEVIILENGKILKN